MDEADRLPTLTRFDRPRNAGECLLQAAAMQGVRIPPHTAERIAAAVLEYAEDEHRSRIFVAEQQWDDPTCRQIVRDRQRRGLMYDLATRELLPVALPREVVIPPGAGAPWKPRAIELVVPVRKPASR